VVVFKYPVVFFLHHVEEIWASLLANFNYHWPRQKSPGTSVNNYFHIDTFYNVNVIKKTTF